MTIYHICNLVPINKHMIKVFRSLFITISFLGILQNLNAQQDPYVTHYMFNRMLYNPAAAGARGLFCLSAMSHYQYVGYEDRTPEFYPANATAPPPPANKSVGPKTQFFSFSAPIRFNHVNYGGLGIGFMNDKLGYESSTHIKIDACGRLPLGEGSAISAGFEYNSLQKGLDGTKLKPLAPLDPLIPTNKVTQTKPSFGAGIYYNNDLENNAKWKDLWAGLSMSNINQQKYTYGTGTSFTYSTTEKHIYLIGGATMIDFLGNPNLKLHPSMMFRRNTVNQIELTGLLEYQDKLWGGLNYRSTVDALSIMLGYSGFQKKLKGLRIGYSYDITLSRIIRVSSGSHEIQLNYCFDLSIPPPPIKKYYTPRHLDRQIEND